jgi:hypothetical protein
VFLEALNFSLDIRKKNGVTRFSAGLELQSSNFSVTGHSALELNEILRYTKTRRTWLLSLSILTVTEEFFDY